MDASDATVTALSNGTNFNVAEFVAAAAQPVPGLASFYAPVSPNENITQAENFEIQVKQVETPSGPVSVTHLTFSKVIDPDLMKSLCDITDDEKFYSDTHTVPISYFTPYLNEIQRRVEMGNYSLLYLTSYLVEHNKDTLQQLERMQEDGKITFNHLTTVFSVGTEIIGSYNGEPVGGIVQSTELGTDQMGNVYLYVRGSVIKSEGSKFKIEAHSFVISDFRGLRRIEDLEVRPITSDEKAMLTERGKLFKKYGLGAKYLKYSGNMYVMGPYGPIFFNAQGRVMVDKIGYSTMNPSNNNYHYGNNSGNGTCDDDLPEEVLFRCWPLLHGFSLVAKRWGNIFVRDLSDIIFDDNAFDYLVIPQEKKDLAKALILNTDRSFTDVISGKSGGCIFLLHGPPGCGKTLTCEAMSEHLKRPLYSITVGELGVAPNELEKSLSRILEIANSWNAVVLIDEADVFLEKRADNDIVRNAMVGIFLRLLERYQGVMFLTTNRNASLDDAFRSRISCVFEYKELDDNTRFAIWTNLVSAAKIQLTADEISQLIHLKLSDNNQKLNGRQIKNAIRMGQCFAYSRTEQLTIEHIKFVVTNM